MSDPTIKRDGERAYFFDEEGVCYRIHDVYFHDHRKKAVPLESPESNTRYFVSEDGTARAYSFKKLEVRKLVPGALLAQLHGSGFVALTPRELGARRPT
jgi:hypothetical protein